MFTNAKDPRLFVWYSYENFGAQSSFSVFLFIRVVELFVLVGVISWVEAFIIISTFSPPFNIVLFTSDFLPIGVKILRRQCGTFELAWFGVVEAAALSMLLMIWKLASVFRGANVITSVSSGPCTSGISIILWVSIIPGISVISWISVSIRVRGKVLFAGK